MNNQILEVYREHWNTFSKKLIEIVNDTSKTIKPANPLLLNLSNDVQDSDMKIMIFGQETNGWEGVFQDNIEISLNVYDRFINSKECFSYGGQYWNGVNRFMTIIKEKYPEKKISLVSNNVVKVGGAGADINCPPEYIYNIEKEFFDVIEKEVEIIQPDIILFLSGPNYDDKLINVLKGAELISVSDKFTLRNLAKVNFKNQKNIFRTYHPNYLWRNNIDEYFDEIINKIEL